MEIVWPFSAIFPVVVDLRNGPEIKLDWRGLCSSITKLVGDRVGVGINLADLRTSKRRIDDFLRAVWLNFKGEGLPALRLGEGQGITGHSWSDDGYGRVLTAFKLLGRRGRNRRTGIKLNRGRVGAVSLSWVTV